MRQYRKVTFQFANCRRHTECSRRHSTTGLTTSLTGFSLLTREGFDSPVAHPAFVDFHSFFCDPTVTWQAVHCHCYCTADVRRTFGHVCTPPEACLRPVESATSRTSSCRLPVFAGKAEPFMCASHFATRPVSLCESERASGATTDVLTEPVNEGASTSRCCA